MYQIYQLEGNVSVTLSLLSLGPEKKKVKCYNEHFINRYVFHTEEYGQDKKRYILVGFVLRDRLLMSLKLLTIGS